MSAGVVWWGQVGMVGWSVYAIPGMAYRFSWLYSNADISNN